MTDTQQLDLDLWLNEEIVRRQNRLKLNFEIILGEVADSFTQKSLQEIHPNSKGKKLSRGNDLMGLPYQVLDFVRDFDWEIGLNLRLLNWFGKGFYLLALVGKRDFGKIDLSNSQFEICRWENPFDYPELISESSSNPISGQPEFIQWAKKIDIVPEPDKTKDILIEEVKKVFTILQEHLAKNQN
ncbi:hypothetical protein [Algoriphagus sp. CAU 1675]|uniref:hypothetical protein n=1 Tax=Algoriphagus sp. CAU 1675 TaxID=3032597 RepID=UPI0023D98265|nr:hypothetical protein [Algoriphagus sp. CAU 1675]MDF2158289.1 hypothetical protein [Algoriphagus sp. CAU 1675]